MGAVVALESLLESRRIWRGQPAPRPPSRQPTGHALLDEALPDGGWPEHALSELLLPADGIGELRLLWPTLARLSLADGMIALVAPPYLPFAQAWANAGIQLNRLQVVRTDPRNALWATEQCLRSAACSAVLCWPQGADDKAMRRLQVAAETGQCLGFAMRPMKAAINPSPVALRIAIDAQPAQLRVLKCRGGNPPPRPIPFPPPMALSFRSPQTPGQEVDGGDRAEKPAMDGRRPASGQGECRPACAASPCGLCERPARCAGPDREAALMKDRSTIPAGHFLREEAAPAPHAISPMRPEPATPVSFRPLRLPEQAQ